MKVGIMSMQRVINYGSFLQAYGLKKVIESLGHEVQFVDYQVEPALVSDKENTSIKNSKVSKVLRMLSPEYRKYRKKQIKMNQTFAAFCHEFSTRFLPELGVTEQSNYCPQLDALVIGSDEVFNCTQSGDKVGYSRQLFGKNHKAQKILSYAASFGSTTLEKLYKYKIAEEVSSLLGEFCSISVRDDNSYQIIQELCDIKASKNIDPVLLYDFPEVSDIVIDLKDYVVVYAYADRIKGEEAAAIQQFAQKRKKKILTLGFWQPFADEYILASPMEVLAYIKNADYVITDTFHGTVFSIKYQVPFGTIIRESNKQKLEDLLDTFNLCNRQIVNINDIEEVLEKSLNVERIKNILADEQEKAKDYLKNNL